MPVFVARWADESIVAAGRDDPLRHADAVEQISGDTAPRTPTCPGVTSTPVYSQQQQATMWDITPPFATPGATWDVDR